jgi:hypothetical protein
MNWPSILLWGFAATAVLTVLMAASQSRGYTRMSIPFLLGTMVTPNRDRAMFAGLLLHMMNGWLFALVYALAFESWGRAAWWLGAGIGVVHGLFVLTVGMPSIPAMHPRMVSEYFGPTPNRQLQPRAFWRSTTVAAPRSWRSWRTWSMAPFWARSTSSAGRERRRVRRYIPIRGMVLTSSALMPAIAPSPACQPPLHSLQTAIPCCRFVRHGHSPILSAQ